MSGERFLIVNADDFGQNEGVNRGIGESHERGIVTSASLMVRWQAASTAAAYARAHPKLSVGLHFDLGEWAFRDGNWVQLYQMVPLDNQEAVAAELGCQLTAFRQLMGRDPTHLDSHQHVHREEPIRSLLAELARELGVPLRHCNTVARYCGEFYGQTSEGAPLADAISVDGLLNIISTLERGITELSCHPGLGHELDSMYGCARAQEVATLCDPSIRAAINALGIKLCSFHDVVQIDINSRCAWERK